MSFNTLLFLVVCTVFITLFRARADPCDTGFIKRFDSSQHYAVSCTLTGVESGNSAGECIAKACKYHGTNAFNRNVATNKCRFKKCDDGVFEIAIHGLRPDMEVYSLPGFDAEQYHDIACTGEHNRISCYGDQVIAIQFANYGRAIDYACMQNYAPNTLGTVCKSSVRYILGAECNGKSSCEFAPSTEKFGAECSHAGPYLQYGYRCITPVIEETVHDGIGCSGERLRMECDGDQEIVIQKAIYGRTNKNDCTRGNHPSALEKTCKSDVADIVKVECNGKNHCEFIPNKRSFGAECSDAGPYLDFTYKCITSG